MDNREFGEKLSFRIIQELDRLQDRVADIKAANGPDQDLARHEFANDLLFGQEAQLLDDLGDILVDRLVELVMEYRTDFGNHDPDEDEDESVMPTPDFN